MSYDLKTIEYFKQHFEEVLKLMPVVLETQGETAIHQMRVEIKKLHALVKLLGKTEPKSAIKEKFIPVRRLFKKIGTIRELQLEIKKIKDLFSDNYPQTPNLTDKLEKKKGKISSHHEKWEKMIQSSFQNFINFDYSIEIKLLQDYFRKLITAANNLMLQENFHEARKNIKSVLYLKALLKVPEQESTGIDFNYLNELQEKIGNWNDLLSSSLRKNQWKENVVLETNFQELHGILKKEAQDFLDLAYPKS